MNEMLTLPHVQECEVPDYFTGNMLDDGKLPKFLLKVGASAVTTWL